MKYEDLCKFLESYFMGKCLMNEKYYYEKLCLLYRKEKKICLTDENYELGECNPFKYPACLNINNYQLLVDVATIIDLIPYMIDVVKKEDKEEIKEFIKYGSNVKNAIKNLKKIKRLW